VQGAAKAGTHHRRIGLRRIALRVSDRYLRIRLQDRTGRGADVDRPPSRSLSWSPPSSGILAPSRWKWRDGVGKQPATAGLTTMAMRMASVTGSLWWGGKALW